MLPEQSGDSFLSYGLLYECVSRTYITRNSHSYTHLISALGIRLPTVGGFITSPTPLHTSCVTGWVTYTHVWCPRGRLPRRRCVVPLARCKTRLNGYMHARILEHACPYTSACMPATTVVAKYTVEQRPCSCAACLYLFVESGGCTGPISYSKMVYRYHYADYSIKRECLRYKI